MGRVIGAQNAAPFAVSKGFPPVLTTSLAKSVVNAPTSTTSARYVV